MEKYIEVYGESHYEETPKVNIIDIDISVFSSKEKAAREEIKATVNSAIDELLEHGLDKSELRFGGKEEIRPWWRKKKVGSESRNRITIRTDRTVAAHKALEKLNRHRDSKKIRFQITERQPVYEASENDKSKALAEAVLSAKSKAQYLAEAAGLKLGPVLEISEEDREVRGSGSYGDHDWGPAVFKLSPIRVARGREDEDPIERLAANVRTVYLNYRVKFSTSEA